MAYGGYTFNKIQLGREATPGIAVAATSIWRGMMAMPEDARERQTVEEQVGLFAPQERTYTTMLLAKLAMPSTELTFEQVCHFMEAGVKAATPSGSGTYTRLYDFPVGATPNAIKTYSIEAGNVLVPTDVQKIEYCFVEEFELSGKVGEAWKMSGNWIGRQLTPTPFTASLPLLTVREAVFARTKLYIDASGGAVGTTQKTGVLMAAKVRVRTGIVYVPVGDGNLTFATHKFTFPKIDFSLTYEVEDSSVVVAERTAFANDVPRLFRVRVDGANSSTHSMTIDFAGKYDKVNGYENENGNTTMSFDGHAIYSSADALFWKNTVINQIATL
jgi:hypothetical protein